MRMFTKLMLIATAVFAVIPAFAQDAAAHAASGGMDLKGFGATLGVGIAALGGALGQGRVGASALEGISRNPASQDKMGTNFILSLVFIETLVIFMFVIAILKA